MLKHCQGFSWVFGGLGGLSMNFNEFQRELSDLRIFRTLF